MRWWLLLLAAVGAEECHREFFAQPVVYDRAMSIDFYYTAINQQSTAACAAFCGERHFCRTAVYNSNAKTCAISYEYTLNCRYNNKRVKEFDARNSSSHLVQIACVPKCNELSSRTDQKKKILAGEPEELFSGPPSTLKRIQLITGEPNDGFREPSSRLARNRPRPVKDTKAEEPGFVNKLVIENVNSGGILPVLDEKHMIRRKSQICYRLREKKYLMGSAFETHKDVSLQTCRCLCAHTYFTNSIFMCKSFNWRADGTCELNRGHHMGRYDIIDDNRFVYQFIDCDIQVLMGIANKFCTKDGLAISSTTTTTEAAIVTTPTTEHSTQVTVNSTPEPTTELTSTTANPPETTEAARSQPETTSASPIESTSSTVTAEASTIEATAEPTSSTVNSITPDEEKAGFIVSSRREEASKEDFLDSGKSTESTSTETTTTTKTSTATTEQPTESVTETSEVTTTSQSQENLPIEKSTCFERIPGYMMGSVAAALEHDVTLEECECFCANSRSSGRHGFDCTSATYYHSERDCVLNLEDRYQKKKYFAKQADFNVTYLGLTCPTEKAIEALVSPDKTYGCRAAPRVYKPKKKPNKGAFSDACFEEFHSHVLEGNAFHAETNATPQQCKCLCAASEQKFNETCQSFLYYYEGAVCLLSKNNRFSTPDKFSHLPDQLLRSYFEYKCASQEDKVKAYTQQMCLFQKAVDDAPSEKSNHTLTDQTSRPLTLLEGGNTTLVEGEASSNHTLEGSGDVIETTTELITTTEITTIPTTTKKVRTRKPINRAIPETEGLNESDFEDLEGILSNNLEDPPTTPIPKKIHGVKTVKLTDKVEKAVQEDMTSTTVIKPPSSSVTTPSTTKLTKPTRRTTTTTTEKPLEYPSAGKCTYSALYQTAFFGRRTIKTVHVKTATDCFAACYALNCRSANLIAQGTLNQCELFRDSLIDYRRPDMIGYDGSTVYFDGIRCDGI